MRYPIELATRQVLPATAKPEVTADDAPSVSRPFALLLAEAEAVNDVVRLRSAAPAGAATLRGAWEFLCARVPWSGVLGNPAAGVAPRADRPRRR